MVKKLLFTSFALFYASFNTGMIVHFHFCFETFQHLTVIVQPENCCGGDCPGCHNYAYELKINSDYSIENTVSFSAVQVLSIAHLSFGYSIAQPLPVDQPTVFVDTGPLIHSGKYPIYLANRVFLI